jgi:hypothetical protein
VAAIYERARSISGAQFLKISWRARSSCTPLVGSRLLADAGRLQTFNQRIAVNFPSKKNVQITAFEDFEDLKESQVITIASSAGLLGGGVDTVLDKELKRRNNAAHPSTVVFGPYQAQDAITDLVTNVVLKLK